MMYNHPLAGYSRSVYYTLTGQKVPVTLTHLDGGIQIRSKLSEKQNIVIYPNPGDGDFTSIRVEYYDSGQNYYYIIHDLLGRPLQKGILLANETSFSTSMLSSGLYLISIFNNTELLKTIKWSKPE